MSLRGWQTRLAKVAGGLGCLLFSPVAALAATGTDSGTNGLLVLALLGVVVGGVALFFALQARSLAINAAQEASTARARAQSAGGPLTQEALVATERVWATRIQALEAQVQSAGRPSAKSMAGQEKPAVASNPNLLARIEELEKIVAGMNMSIYATQSRRAPAAPSTPTGPAVNWPAVLQVDRPGMGELRQTLQQAIKVGDNSVEELLTQLRTVDQWVSRRPNEGEVVVFLQEVSQLLFAALRRGAAVAPLDASMLADRLLGALRLSWQSLYPAVECRFFYPGATFDPDWMEDQNPAGLRRPTISEMLSWAVFEKQTNGRKVLAKARVTTE